ncbi:uncharacterized protein LOC132174959 [Corylus avellana]|uniref:uncharacterized protein LOC132174959 n=1 Tax=Corylus avellana TaxID=13451 RepID=UPI00286CE33F|nr:uncharacterized protein LOC132174959 [Corylus avellana]
MPPTATTTTTAATTHLDAWLKLNGSCPVSRNLQLPTSLSTPLSEVVSLSQYAADRRRRRKMGLWTLLEGCLLLANALAILNEDRFLAHRGLSFSEFSGGTTKSFKGQLIGLIYATQYLRVPLILLNFICIVVKLVSG